jgi:predicted O-methyltransferase YrrM
MRRAAAAKPGPVARWRARSTGPALRLVLVALHLSSGRSDHSEEEYACLRDWAAGRGTAVEIGVAEGRGTALIRTAIARDGVVFAVDPFPAGRLGFSPARLIARTRVRRASRRPVRWLRATAHEARPIVAATCETIEFVFSDACFTAPDLSTFWAEWRGLVAPGGIFVQSTSRPAPGRADSDHDTVRWTEEVLRRDPDFECVAIVGTFTVLRRLPPTTSR